MTYDPYGNNPKQPGDPYGQPGHGAPQTPGYGMPGQQPGYGYPPPPKSQQSAVLALVLSCVGFLCCLTAPVGIVFGHIALGKIKRGEEDGKGMALAGTIIGYVVVVGYLLYIVAIFALGWYGYNQELNR